MALNIQRLVAFEESEDCERGKKIINKLLSHWCIPRWKDSESDADWRFISRNQDALKDILDLSGYALTIVNSPGREIAYISVDDALFAPQRMTKVEATVFLSLRLLYEERMKAISLDAKALNARLSAEEILNTVCFYRKANPGRTEMKELLTILKKMEAINVCCIEGAKKEFNKESYVTIFPSVAALLPAATIENITAMLDDYKAETTKKIYADEAGESNDDEPGEE